MTQTPASGPLGPITTPPMSSVSIATSLAGCCAWDEATGRIDHKTTLTPRPRINCASRLVGMIDAPLGPVEERMVPLSTHNSQPRNSQAAGLSLSERRELAVWELCVEQR